MNMKMLLLSLGVLCTSCAPYGGAWSDVMQTIQMQQQEQPGPCATFGNLSPPCRQWVMTINQCHDGSLACHEWVLAKADLENDRLRRLSTPVILPPPPPMPPGYDPRRDIVSSCLRQLREPNSGYYGSPMRQGNCGMIYNHPDQFLR